VLATPVLVTPVSVTDEASVAVRVPLSDTGGSTVTDEVLFVPGVSVIAGPLSVVAVPVRPVDVGREVSVLDT